MLRLSTQRSFSLLTVPERSTPSALMVRVVFARAAENAGSVNARVMTATAARNAAASAPYHSVDLEFVRIIGLAPSSTWSAHGRRSVSHGGPRFVGPPATFSRAWFSPHFPRRVTVAISGRRGRRGTCRTGPPTLALAVNGTVA